MLGVAIRDPIACAADQYEKYPEFPGFSSQVVAIANGFSNKLVNLLVFEPLSHPGQVIIGVARMDVSVLSCRLGEKLECEGTGSGENLVCG